MALNITAIERAAGKAAPYLLNDGGGLYVKVCPNGRKVWLYRYRDEGERERKVTLGEYPALDLPTARERKEATRARILRGEAPQDTALLTFEQAARRWYEKQKKRGLAPRYLETIRQRLECYLIPPLGARPLEQIQRAELVAVVESVAKRGIIESSHRVGVILSQIYQYA
uniref:tyrosine-type recombinase/integrase n=1 Tax=Pyramidobacter piscolens TaxID=638849 RepID=UPI003AB69837